MLRVGLLPLHADWVSLPQLPRAAGEPARFERATRRVHELYMHPFTFVLMLGRGGVPTDTVAYSHNGKRFLHTAPYANPRPWEARGWTFFEGCCASVVKDDECLWDFAMSDGAGTLDGLRSTLRAGRPPPLSPDAFEQALGVKMREGEVRFSAPADAILVCELYRSGFVEAFDAYRFLKREDNVLYYSGLGWGAQEALVLKVALAYVAQHCFSPGTLAEDLDADAVMMVVDLSRNDFGEEEERALREALEPCGERVQLRFEY